MMNNNSSLKMVAWELTRGCNLDCVHCRASSTKGKSAEELSTGEVFRVIDELSSFARPVMLLSGGEPLLREDIFEIVGRCVKRGLPAALATNGTLLDRDITLRLKDLGLHRVSISIDGADENTHDKFRGITGGFKDAVKGIGLLRKAGIPFQINTTVTTANIKELPRILKFVSEIGAVAWHIFLLVPTGRGKDFPEGEISAVEYENTLRWFASCEASPPFLLELKVTCAPHYQRILREMKVQGEMENSRRRSSRGCMAGTGFCFISFKGDLQPCGYLNLKAGNIREKDFESIWEEAKLFRDLRDFSLYKGKCGVCEYIKICGGCRARAYAKTGDYLEEEPKCSHEIKN